MEIERSSHATPMLRGVLHQFAAFCAAGAGSVLVAMSSNLRAGIAAAV